MELKTEGLYRDFDGFIFDSDINAAEGELVCLLGPSGCGKTTALRMIAGISLPEEGRVYLGDREITRLPPWKRNIGLVFQDYALFPHMSVFENIAYGLRTRKWKEADIRARVEELMGLVHLPGYADRKPASLSGGEQQRVALARALAPYPSLLLLDEPLSALDAQLRKRLRREIRSIQRRLGLTTVYVTHDQEEALTMSDRIVLMRDGRVEQSGTPREMYRNPSGVFAARFLGNSNLVPLQAALRAGLPADALPEGIGEELTEGLAEGPAEELAARPASYRSNSLLFFRPEDTVLSLEPPEDASARITFYLPVTYFEFLGSHYVAEGEVPHGNGSPEAEAGATAGPGSGSRSGSGASTTAESVSGAVTIRATASERVAEAGRWCYFSVRRDRTRIL
jgi:ABC-type Fe3+/spermidine/putrescine transport system ATPase subunit